MVFGCFVGSFLLVGRSFLLVLLVLLRFLLAFLGFSLGLPCVFCLWVGVCVPFYSCAREVFSLPLFWNDPHSMSRNSWYLYFSRFCSFIVFCIAARFDSGPDGQSHLALSFAFL